MKKIFLASLSLGLCLSFSPLIGKIRLDEADLKVKMPVQGPPGPPGPIGPMDQLVYSYASAQGSEQVIKAKTFYPLRFNKKLVSPVKIEHYENETQFRVQKTGFYMIGWTILARSASEDEIKINLLNVKTEEDLKPFPQMSISFSENETKTFSGQLITHLMAGETFQFEVLSRNGNLSVTPSLIVLGLTP